MTDDTGRTLIEGFGGKDAEWPELLVVGDLLPPSIRVAVAATASSHLGESSEFILLMRQLATTSAGPLRVDDWYLSPPTNHAVRIFLRAWLSGADDRYWVPNDPPAPGGETSSLTLLSDFAILRSPDAEDLRHAVHLIRSPGLRRLALRLLGEREGAPVSPLLEYLSAKRRGDLAFLCEDFDTAVSAYADAEKILLSGCPAATINHFRVHLQLSQLAARGDRAESLRSCVTLRNQYSGSPKADTVEFALGRLQFEDAVLRGQLPRAAHLPVEVAETAAALHVLQVYEQAAEDAYLRNDPRALALANNCRLLAIGAGLDAALRDIETLCGRILLRREEHLRALLAYVRSARHDISRDLQELDADKWQRLVRSVQLSDLSRLHAAANERPSQAAFRMTAYASIVAELVSSQRAAVEDRIVFVPEAVRLALDGMHTILANVSPGTPAAKALVAILDEDAPLVLHRHGDAILDAALALVDGNKPWAATELGLQMLFYSLQVDAFGADTARTENVALVVVGLVESLSAGGGHWPVLVPAFAVLSQRAMRQVLASNPLLASRARGELLRHFSANKQLAKIHADIAVRLLSQIPDASKNDINVFVESAITESRDVHSSQAMPSLVRLLSVADALDAASVDRLANATVDFVAWRGADGEPAFAITSACHAVFDLATRDTPSCSALALKSLRRAVLQLLVEFGDKPWNIARSFDGNHQPVVLSNWVHVLILLGRRVDDMSEIDAAIEHLASFDEAAARAVYRGRLNALDRNVTAAEISFSDAETFYLGASHALSKEVAVTEARDLVQRLLSGVLAFGPRPADLAVLSWARRMDPPLSVTSDAMREYLWRLEGGRTDREMRDLLRSLLTAIRAKPISSSSADPTTDLRISDMSRLLAAMAEPDMEVQLDIESSHASASLETARRMEMARQSRIRAGRRVARIMRRTPAGRLERVFETGVALDDARRLLDAGARWTGPNHYRP